MIPNPKNVLHHLPFSQVKTSSELNEITKVEFQVNDVYLNKEFCQDYIQAYRDWLFSHFSRSMQQLLKIIFYNQLATIKENVPLFDWLNTYLRK